MKRIFVCKEGSSNKMWSVEAKSDNSVEIKWGRVSLPGQSQVKTFNTSGAMQAFIADKISEKLGKGYTEITNQQLTEEVKVAESLGWRYKIVKIQWVDLALRDGIPTGKAAIVPEYDQSKFVLIEIMNSWTKYTFSLLLNKEKGWVVGITNKFGNKIDFKVHYVDGNSGRVIGVRQYLKDTFAKIKNICSKTVKFAALGLRQLDLGEDGEIIQDKEVQEAAIEIGKEMNDSNISTQVVSQFIALGNRCLDL